MKLAGSGIQPVTDFQSVAGVLSGSDELVDNDGAFFLGANLNATASNYSYVQLKNPLSSGIKVFVDAIIVSSTGNVRAEIREYDTDLSLLLNLNASNKNFGSAQTAQVRYEWSTSSLGSTKFYQLIGAYRGKTWRFPKPLELTDSHAIIVTASAVNTTLTVGFQWREVAT